MCDRDNNENNNSNVRVTHDTRCQRGNEKDTMESRCEVVNAPYFSHTSNIKTNLYIHLCGYSAVALIMKVSYISFIVLPSASAFVADTPRRKTRLTPLLDVTRGGPDDAVDRRDFVKTAVSSVVTIGLLGVGGEPAFATGRATLDQTFERYAPRIRAGGEFYQGEFKQMVAKGDFQAIKEATEGVPPRKKGDLQVCDSDCFL